MIVIAYQDTSEILQPCKHALNLPPVFVPAQHASILRLWARAPAELVRRYQLNAMVDSQPEIKRVTVVRLVSYQTLGLFISDKTLGDSLLNKGDFMRRSSRNVYGDRKTIAICNCHDFRTFAPLGRSDFVPPFLALDTTPS